MNKAQAILVNYHHKLSLPSYWGDGTTSSSDGMRVQIGMPREATCLFEENGTRKKNETGQIERWCTIEITHLSLFAWLLDTSMISNKEGVFLSINRKRGLGS
ncbi:hypothetical protein GCM10020370_03570 [Paenibacillus hodogayensis]